MKIAAALGALRSARRTIHSFVTGRCPEERIKRKVRVCVSNLTRDPGAFGVAGPHTIHSACGLCGPCVPTVVPSMAALEAQDPSTSCHAQPDAQRPALATTLDRRVRAARQACDIPAPRTYVFRFATKKAPRGATKAQHAPPMKQSFPSPRSSS